LLKLIDEDTAAFDELMACFGLPKGSDEEKAARAQAIQVATKWAVEVPLEVMQVALDSMNVIRAMAEIGNPNSVSDAGVGALAARSAVLGAELNVKINCGSIEDNAFVDSALKKARSIAEQAIQLESEILRKVDEKIASL
jgi:glutamate formiminotransferase/formiminotetrahydrofolate cyclodeaminase